MMRSDLATIFYPLSGKIAVSTDIYPVYYRDEKIEVASKQGIV